MAVKFTLLHASTTTRNTTTTTTTARRMTVTTFGDASSRQLGAYLERAKVKNVRSNPYPKICQVQLQQKFLGSKKCCQEEAGGDQPAELGAKVLRAVVRN